jgi:hypothetical protein
MSIELPKTTFDGWAKHIFSKEPCSVSDNPLDAALVDMTGRQSLPLNSLITSFAFWLVGVHYIRFTI